MMKKYILIVLGIIALCLLGIELFYESPVIEGDDLIIEDDLEINMPIFDQSLDSTAELSTKVQHILELYVPYISSDIDDTCFAIDLYAHRHSSQLVDLSIRHADIHQYEEGVFCGTSRFGGHVVRLWGENINDFWVTAGSPIEVQSDSNSVYSCDDQCSWWLCIDLDNQEILPHKVLFLLRISIS